MDNFIVHFYKNNSKNKHTTKATNSWYTLWAEDNNQIVKIHAIENAVELNKVLELFFSNVKRINNYYSTKVSYYMLGSSSSRKRYNHLLRSTSSSPEKENTDSNRLGTPPRRGVEKPEGPSALQPTTEYSTKVSYYMLGSSSSRKRDKYINTWIRVQYRFIFLVFFIF